MTASLSALPFLALDRSRESSALSEGDRQALRRLANLAMRLSNRGLIDLVQRRICRDRFSYLAIARPRPNSTPLSFLTVAFKETV